MPKGFIYIRYSTAEQGAGDSKERQIRLAREFVRSRPEMSIDLAEDQLFVDEGVSSFLGKNLGADKGLGRFLALVDAKEVPHGSVLLVESLDRLSRQEIQTAQRVLLDILGRGIVVATTSPVETNVYNGQSGLIDLIVMLTRMERAHAESALKSRRVKAAWTVKHEKARKNTIITRVCPSWLTVSEDGNSFIVDEVKAQAVRTIFACAESMGYQSIARYLNETNVPPLSSRSRGWQSSTIVKILHNVAVMGTYQPRTINHVETEHGQRRRTSPDGAPINGYYPSIIPVAEFNRIQEMRKVRSTASAGRKGPTVSNLFSHVACCGQCGSNMVLVQKGGSWGTGHYLVCSIARRGAGCEYHGWPYQPLEDAFLQYCQNVDLSELVPEDASDRTIASLRQRLQSARGERSVSEATLKKTVEDVGANGGVLPKSIQAYLVQLESRIEELDGEVRDIETDLAKEEEKRRDMKAFGSMFSALLKKLGAAEDAERFRLRSGLQKAIRSAVVGMKLFKSPSTLHEEWAAAWGKDMPKITRHCIVGFRVGLVKALYFSGRKLVFTMDYDDQRDRPLVGARINEATT